MPTKKLSKGPSAKDRSSTAKGNAFRDAVASLLRTKHGSVEIEKELCGKYIDIVYKENRFDYTEIIGVECKDYARPLTATEITREILADYKTVLERRAIDILLIVGRQPLGGLAKKRLDEVRGVRYLTFEKLEEELLGLGEYVKSLEGLHSEQGLDTYYIEARFEGETTSAYESIKSWLATPNTHPLALLGGYGQGKTSLARRVIAAQASEYIDDNTKRIPILIRLGEIVHETSLEGLFGKEFAARHQSRYHFNTFRHLNDSGRLLIVLDGFDEMKHGMTESDFRANFAEFNRLIVPNSKVILLGRPNAFSSEMRRLVLRGRKRISEKEIVVPGMSSWIERQVAAFSRDETSRFLRGYLRHLIAISQEKKKILDIDEVDNRIAEIFSDVDLDLISRPVHARIIAELAISPEVKFKGFNEYDLYSQFIRQIIERDAELKRARKQIPIGDRMRFQQRLAYWAWCRPNQAQGHFLREEIPRNLLEGLHDGATGDDEGKWYEYIVSTVTDAKDSGHLYFAHRSFQEFLVAEYLRTLDPAQVNHERNSAAIDEAIALFLLGSRDLSFLQSWYESLPSCHAKLSTIYLGLFMKCDAVVCVLKERLRLEISLLHENSDLRMSTEEVALLGLISVAGHHAISHDEAFMGLKAILVRGSKEAAALAYHYLLRICRSKLELLEVLSLSLHDRPMSRIAALRRSDRIANRLVLGDDWVADATKATLSPLGGKRINAVLWEPNRTYSNITRLIRLRNRLALEDAPDAAFTSDSPLCQVRITKKDLEDAGGDLEFRELVEVVPGKEEHAPIVGLV